jgi:tetratricopeptide (TPR) repeat protein
MLQTFSRERSTTEARADAQVLIASYWLAAGDIPATEQALLEGAKLAETFDVVQSLAEFYFRPANRPKEALPWFDKAVQLAQKKQSANLPNVLAARISCINNLDVADKQIDEFVRTYPDDNRGLLLRSEWHASMGGMDKAVDALSSYLSRSPNDVTILFRRAQHYVAQGRMAMAIADLEQIKRNSPLGLQLDPRIQLSRLYQRMGRSDLGIRELEELVKETTGAARAVEELVEAYIRENRLSDAERLVTGEINNAKDSPDARWFALRARISVALNDTAGALADSLRAAELGAYSRDLLMKALDAFALANKFSEGAAYFEEHGKAHARTSRGAADNPQPWRNSEQRWNWRRQIRRKRFAMSPSD